VRLHRPLRQDQPGRDLPVGQRPSEQGGDLAFPVSLRIRFVVTRMRARRAASVLAAGRDEAGFVGQHNGLDAVAEAEFGQYPPDMDLDGSFGQV
jgi:hypothetical protein